jgi:hypothetical protein
MLAVHEAGMAGQQEGGKEEHESLVRRRLRMAEELAAQMRTMPEQPQPLLQHDDRPLPVPQSQAAAVSRPLDTISSAPPQPTPSATRTPSEHPAIASGSPLTIDADWPLLREFTGGASQFRQLSIGDLLDAAFRLYHRRFAFLIAIAALLLAPVGLVLLLFQQSSGVQTLMLFFQNIFLTPLISATAISTLLYVDLRIRREGYDLEMLARQAERPNI